MCAGVEHWLREKEESSCWERERKKTGTSGADNVSGMAPRETTFSESAKSAQSHFAMWTPCLCSLFLHLNSATQVWIGTVSCFLSIEKRHVATIYRQETETLERTIQVMLISGICCSRVSWILAYNCCRYFKALRRKMKVCHLDLTITVTLVVTKAHLGMNLRTVVAQWYRLHAEHTNSWSL